MFVFNLWFFAARTSCPSHVMELVRQIFEGEGVILTVPWCEAFSFQIEDIFTRLRIVEKEKTRGIVTTKEVTSMACIFTPQEECKQPLICVDWRPTWHGKDHLLQKLAFDWVSEQCREWDKSFPRIDVLLHLRCRGIKSTFWDAIQLLSEKNWDGGKRDVFPRCLLGLMS